MTTTRDLPPESASLIDQPEDEVMLRDAVSRIARSFGPGYYVKQSEAGEPARELWKALGDNGFLGVSLPEEYGGGGLGVWALAIVAEEMAAAGCPLIPVVFSQSICGSILARYGTDEQKDRYLRGIASGDVKFSFAITEPDAGSNSHNLSTAARRDGDQWVLNGAKTYISGVEDADYIMVVAKTGERPDGRGLLSLFIVDGTETGLSRQHIPVALTAPDKQWSLFFDNVRISADRLVAGENNGLKAVFDGLNPERVLGAAICNGVGRYALDKAVAYANQRVVWKTPIGAHQGVAHPLAEAKVQLEAARLMTEKAARLVDAGRPAGETANMAKYLAAEAGVACLDTAIQCHGGNGLALEYELTYLWWLVRLLRIVPVSREMILNYVAEHTLGLPRSY